MSGGKFVKTPHGAVASGSNVAFHVFINDQTDPGDGKHSPPHHVFIPQKGIDEQFRLQQFLTIPAWKKSYPGCAAGKQKFSRCKYIFAASCRRMVEASGENPRFRRKSGFPSGGNGNVTDFRSDIDQLRQLLLRQSETGNEFRSIRFFQLIN